MTLHLNLIERFPEYQEKIRNLLETNSTFLNVAQRYGEVSEQLGSTPDETDPEHERLLRRRADLESELLYIMEEKSRP